MKSSEDFMAAFDYGERDGKPREFTYCLTDEGLLCTETGSALPRDLASKHAIICNAAYSVRCAGQFHFQWDSEGYWLVLDNESGTYSPQKEALELTAKLLRLNMPDIGVEILDIMDPKEKEILRKYRAKLDFRAKTVEESRSMKQGQLTEALRAMTGRGKRPSNASGSTTTSLMEDINPPRAPKMSFCKMPSEPMRSSPGDLSYEMPVAQSQSWRPSACAGHEADSLPDSQRTHLGVLLETGDCNSIESQEMLIQGTVENPQNCEEMPSNITLK